MRLERTGERVLELDLLYGIGCKGGLLVEGTFVHRGETAGLGKSADCSGLVEGGGAVEGLVEKRGQQRSEFGGMMLRGKYVGAESQRGGVGRVFGYGFCCGTVDAHFGGGAVAVGSDGRWIPPNPRKLCAVERKLLSPASEGGLSHASMTPRAESKWRGISMGWMTELV